VASAASFFSLRALALTLCLCLGYVLLINLDMGDVNPYQGWYDTRVDIYYRKLDSLNRIRAWRDRMFTRHVANYEAPIWVVKNMRDGDTILLPPRQYAQDFIKADAYWTDPRIFTYMAGLTPIVAFADTARRKSANAFISLAPRRIAIVRRGGETNIDSLLRVYEEAARE